ncbi:hypothetical protein [Bacteroides sp. 51]|uniref:hypothetical protein n=1 Tax=Bacteroides sp. 51 TaxID=2302938 RepID=UPI0013D18C6E|nr:hypothetical protein [Bacteroides sp. 51]NDV80775.1 hypothetical protein [Bacteroides sp. 51]
MRVQATIILGDDATRYYNETGRIPSKRKLDELGGIILDKEFGSKEEYDAYIAALEESDGWDDYIVAQETHDLPDKYSLDDRIKHLLAEGPLVALYFLIGINILKDTIDNMKDEELTSMFEGLMHPERVRKNIEHLYDKMNTNKTKP